jgi:LysR family transcriptional activator of nhaA
MRINYNHLRYFWFVAHEGNLTRAAKQLHISQSALSVQIKTLAAQLGHDLFEHRGRTLVLTEAGRIVLDYADHIFKTGNEMLNKLSNEYTRERQVIRIGVIATLSRNFQIQFIKPLIKSKDVDIVISSGSLSELLTKLETHQMDIILANNSPFRDASTPWVTHLISTQPVSLLGDSRYARTKRSLSDLLSHEPLIVPTVESNIRIDFDALIERMGIRPNIVAEINDMAMLRLIAREKIGLALAPPIVVQDEIKEGSLKEIKKVPELQENFYAITLKRQFPNPLLNTLICS